MIARITIRLEILLEADSLQQVDEQIQGASLGFIESMFDDKQWLGGMHVATIERVPYDEVALACQAFGDDGSFFQ